MLVAAVIRNNGVWSVSQLLLIISNARSICSIVAGVPRRMDAMPAYAAISMYLLCLSMSFSNWVQSDKNSVFPSFSFGLPEGCGLRWGWFRVACCVLWIIFCG